MDFKKATDELCEGISHDELARTLGVSVATVRQARLQQGAKAHRSPPEDWELAIVKLAEQRVHRYQRLIEKVRASQ